MGSSQYIYIIRHGETIWNQEKLLQGRTDIPLSEKGVEQAYEMATLLKDVSIEFIGTSPLIRTHQTASIIANEWVVPLIIFDDLKARQYGPWEGKTIDSIKKENETLFQHIRRFSLEEVFHNPPLDSIESYQQVSERALKPLYQIESDKNVLLVTHSGVATSILLALNFHHQLEYPEIPILGHTGVIKIRRSEGHLVIEEVKGLLEPKRGANIVQYERCFIF